MLSCCLCCRVVVRVMECVLLSSSLPVYSPNFSQRSPYGRTTKTSTLIRTEEVNRDRPVRMLVMAGAVMIGTVVGVVLAMGFYLPIIAFIAVMRDASFVLSCSGTGATRGGCRRTGHALSYARSDMFSAKNGAFKRCREHMSMGRTRLTSILNSQATMSIKKFSKALCIRVLPSAFTVGCTSFTAHLPICLSECLMCLP